jgi:hypothetical protein
MGALSNLPLWLYLDRYNLPLIHFGFLIFSMYLYLYLGLESGSLKTLFRGQVALRTLDVPDTLGNIMYNCSYLDSLDRIPIFASHKKKKQKKKKLKKASPP